MYAVQPQPPLSSDPSERQGRRWRREREGKRARAAAATTESAVASRHTHTHAHTHAHSGTIPTLPRCPQHTLMKRQGETGLIPSPSPSAHARAQPTVAPSVDNTAANTHTHTHTHTHSTLPLPPLLSYSLSQLAAAERNAGSAAAIPLADGVDEDDVSRGCRQRPPFPRMIRPVLTRASSPPRPSRAQVKDMAVGPGFVVYLLNVSAAVLGCCGFVASPVSFSPLSRLTDAPHGLFLHPGRPRVSTSNQPHAGCNPGANFFDGAPG